MRINKYQNDIINADNKIISFTRLCVPKKYQINIYLKKKTNNLKFLLAGGPNKTASTDLIIKRRLCLGSRICIISER